MNIIKKEKNKEKQVHFEDDQNFMEISDNDDKDDGYNLSEEEKQNLNLMKSNLAYHVNSFISQQKGGLISPENLQQARANISSHYLSYLAFNGFRFDDDIVFYFGKLENIGNVDEVIANLGVRYGICRDDLIKKKLIDKDGKKLKEWRYELNVNNWGISVKPFQVKRKRRKNPTSPWYQPSLKKHKKSNQGTQPKSIIEARENFNKSMDSNTNPNSLWNDLSNQQIFRSSLPSPDILNQSESTSESRSDGNDIINQVRNIRKSHGHNLPKPALSKNPIRIDINSLIKNQSNRGINAASQSPLGLDIKDKECIVIRTNQIANNKQLSNQQKNLSYLLNNYSNSEIARTLKGM